MSDLSIGSCNTNFGIYEICPPNKERYPLSQPLNFYQTNLNDALLRNMKTAKNSCLEWFKSLCFSVIPTENQATVLLDQCVYDEVFDNLPMEDRTTTEKMFAIFLDFLGIDNTVDFYLTTLYLEEKHYPLFEAFASLNLPPDTQTLLKIQKLVIQEDNLKDALPLLKDIQNKQVADNLRLFLAQKIARKDCNPKELDPLLDATDTSSIKKLRLKYIIDSCNLQSKSKFAKKYARSLKELIQDVNDPIFDLFHDPENYFKKTFKEALKASKIKELFDDPENEEFLKDPRIKEIINEVLHDPEIKELIKDPEVREILKDTKIEEVLASLEVKEFYKNLINSPLIKESLTDTEIKKVLEYVESGEFLNDPEFSKGLNLIDNEMKRLREKLNHLILLKEGSNHTESPQFDVEFNISNSQSKSI